jgi:hypothetical protein
MTANELAEILENDSKNINGRFTYSSKYIIDIANMLRQQEQKIASLEKDLFILQKHYDQLCEDCTCQGGHSEAYLKAKGKL